MPMVKCTTKLSCKSYIVRVYQYKIVYRFIGRVKPEKYNQLPILIESIKIWHPNSSTMQNCYRSSLINFTIIFNTFNYANVLYLYLTVLTKNVTQDMVWFFRKYLQRSRHTTNMTLSPYLMLISGSFQCQRKCKLNIVVVLKLTSISLPLREWYSVQILRKVETFSFLFLELFFLPNSFFCYNFHTLPILQSQSTAY